MCDTCLSFNFGNIAGEVYDHYTGKTQETDEEKRFIHKDPAKHSSWWQRALHLRGTVSLTTAMVLRLLFFTGISVLLMTLKSNGKLSYVSGNTTINFIPFKPSGHALLATALGLLLVYRTNASYDRFWEGRKLWCGVTSGLIDLVRCIKSWEPETPYGELVDLCISYGILLKRRLRSKDDIDHKVDGYLDEKQRDFIKQMKHNDPVAISMLMSDWVFQHCKLINSQAPRAARVDSIIGSLINSQENMDRIVDCPIPISYVAHINHVLFIFLLTLPFALVDDLGWFSIPMTLMVSFGLLGIEEAGAEIEYPFGNDLNDIQISKILKRTNKTLLKMKSVTYNNPTVLHFLSV